MLKILTFFQEYGVDASFDACVEACFDIGIDASYL